MKIKLVFDDWYHIPAMGSFRPLGYGNSEGEIRIELSMGDFHSGTVFEGEIELDPANAKELETAISKGYSPVFRLIAEQ